jgi:hypothetical protein
MAGEVVGFGLAAAIGAAALPVIQRAEGTSQVLAGAGTLVLIALVEGTALGLAQWLVLRAEVARVARLAWVGATVAGAVAAWSLGMGLGTLAGDQLEALASGSPLLLAMVIGLGAGTLLSLFQWPVLRQAVPRAGWWVPAHAGAWAVGMLVAFAGMGLIAEDTPIPVVAGVGAATGLAMGATVAALTGLALVRLLRTAREDET